MDTPEDLRGFLCDDYFGSQWAREGYFDAASRILLVLPTGQHQLRRELDFLVIGRPGVDGIEFGYRRGMPGIWAYYPIDEAFRQIAETTADLVDGYVSGRITV